MALFPNEEEIVDVPTPDGRTLRLPRSVLATLQMPQQQMAPTAPPPGIVGIQDETAIATGPQDVVEPVTSGLAAPTEESQLVALQTPAPPDVSVTPPAPILYTDAQVKKSNAAYDKRQRDAARAAAQPRAQVAAADAERDKALGTQAEATIEAGLVEQAGFDMQAKAYGKRNEKIDELAAKRAVDLQAAQAAQESKAAELGALRERIAGTKIDRKVDNPILAAISIALYELGTVMKGGTPGQGVEMLYKSIDRKVAAQMADLDQMAKTYGMQKDELAELKERSKNKLEFHNIMIAAETDKAIRQIEEIGARTNSEKMRANTKMLVGQLQERGAAASMEALKWGLDYDQRAQAERNQQGRFYAGLKQADRHHADNVQLKREDMYLDQQKSLAASKAKGDELAYKEKLDLIEKNEERGINNVATGQPILNKKGAAMLKQAEELAAEAKAVRELDMQSPDPNTRQMAEGRARALEEKAAVLRADADIYGRLRGRTPEESRQMGARYGAAQSTMTLIDEIKDLYNEKGRSWVTTDDLRAALQAKFNSLAPLLKEAWQLGAWDKGSAGLVATIIGKDPSTAWDPGVFAAVLSGEMVGTDPKSFMNRLDSVASQLETSTRNDLRQLPGGVAMPEKLFERRRGAGGSPEAQAVKAFQQDKTPGELASEAEKRTGGVKGALYSAGHALNKGIFDWSAPGSPEEAARRAGESGSLEYGGLSVKQGEEMSKWLSAYKGGDQKASATLLTTALDDKRPELQFATMMVLKDHAPDLYSQARKSITSGPVDERLDYVEQNAIALADVPLPMLRMQAMMPDDKDAFAELARRAGEKDKQAGAMLLEVINTRQKRKDPLGISTGGR